MVFGVFSCLIFAARVVFDTEVWQVIAINELLALGFANLGGAICGAVPTQSLGTRWRGVLSLKLGMWILP